MTIHKLGHSCVIVTEGGVSFLFDPGKWVTQDTIPKSISYILVTHLHDDHYDPAFIRKILAANPEAVIVTNNQVGEKLTKEDLPFVALEDGQIMDCAGVALVAFGKDHHPIYPGIPQLVNTGYLIGEKFFHPGDAYTVPPKSVEILAVPFSAPWGTIGASINYAKKVAPKTFFPIHDGMLKFHGPYHSLPEKIFADSAINFIPLTTGQEFKI